MLTCRTFAHVLKKSGYFPAKLTFYDRRLAYAVTQLTYAVYRIKAYSKEQKMIKVRAKELLSKLWERLHRQLGDGRVEETRVTELPLKWRGSLKPSPPSRGNVEEKNPALGPHTPGRQMIAVTTS